MALKTYSERTILAQFDRHAEQFDFPTLDNGYTYPVDVRLTAYRDARRWAVAIEHVGFFNRIPEFQNVIYLFGNCLSDGPGFGPAIPLVDGPDGWTDESGDAVRPGLLSIRIHGKLLKLTAADRSPPAGPSGTPEALAVQDLFRNLLPRARDLYRATEAELRGVVPADLPQILRLDEWEHCDAVRGVLPSHTEFFPLLAKVLVTGDVSLYKPTRPPNTHWSNWPGGGTL